MPMKYLYGAAVQGIQQFIFRTNELKDIVAASDKVKKIGDELFENLLVLNDKKCSVINAAGNIKYIFEKREDCEQVVKNFPRKVLEYAPGITVSQAVVEMESDDDFGKKVNELEKKLRAQRNQPMPSVTLGLMGLERDLKLKSEKDVLKNVNSKLVKDAFGEEEHESIFDTDHMTNQNDWIAVIHADGNGLGQIVQQKGNDREKFQEFSKDLDDATKKSAQEAYEALEEKDWDERHVPIRPIVLGGDDFTVICRGNLAVRYVTAFIKAFEKNSPENLTACAGIAFVKSSFPFYYAYDLAESLCEEAKKASKKIREEKAPSSIMFHKVQDSFLTDYKDIVKRELTMPDGISFKFGPYFVTDKQDDYWTVENLLSKVDGLKSEDKDKQKECNAIKSRLRNWMTLKKINPEMAKQDLDRIMAIAGNGMKEFVKEVTKEQTITIDDKTVRRVPVYDILALRTINEQVTKNPKKKEQ